MKISKQFTFHAAHQLYNEGWSEEKNKDIYGKCTSLHGHSYILTVVVGGKPDETGMLMNFRDLSGMVKEHIIARYDHVFLNELPEFENTPTTSEMIAQEIFNRLEPLITPFGVSLAAVQLKESITSEAIVESASR